MDWTERRERLRAILAGSRCVHPGSVYDAISARIAEDLGFEVGMLAGSTGSLSVQYVPVVGHGAVGVAIDEQRVIVRSPLTQRSWRPSPLRSVAIPDEHGRETTKFGEAAVMIPNDWRTASTTAVHRSRSFVDRVASTL